MTAPIRPTSVKAYGSDKWAYVQTIAAFPTITAVEAIAASTLDVSMMVFDGSGLPDQSTNRVTKTKRLADTVVYEQIGDTNMQGFDMLFQFDAQGAALSNGVKAWEKFSAGGVVGYMVRRVGLPVATDFAAGQFVDVYPVEIGPGIPTTEGTGEVAESAAKCTVAITSAPAFKKALT
jgi:hypothetical protein